MPFQMSTWLNRSKVSGAVVIVAIDDKTVNSYTRGTAPPSALYPALFRKLKDDEAAVVGLAAVLPRDLGLTDPVLSKLLGRSQPAALDVNDGHLAELQRDLAQAIEEQGSTYLGWTIEGSALAPPDYSTPLALAFRQDRHEAGSSPHYGPISPKEVEGNPFHYELGRGDDIVDSVDSLIGSAGGALGKRLYPARYEGSPELLNRAARGTAYLDLGVGLASGVTSAVLPVLNIAGHNYAPFSEAIASDYLTHAPIAVAYTGRNATVSLGRTTIPTAWILYRRPHGTFSQYSAIDVVNGETPRQDLAGKIVLVGFETRNSPKLQSYNGRQYLVELQANAIEDILSKDFIHLLADDSIVYETAIPVGLGLTLFVAYFASSMSDRRLILWSIITVLTSFFVYYGVVVYYLRVHRLYCTWLTPLGFGVLAQTVMFSALFRRRRRFRERFRTAFEHYLDPKIIDAVIVDPAGLELGGEKRHLTILFADIVDFTTKSEALSPEALVKTLNDFMSAMTEVVIKNGGVIDKIIGDSIMAFWGAPARVENPARLAIDCGLEMLAELRRLRERDLRFADFGMGVGIATGEAVVGNLGGERRFDYSVVGDTVNLAARLETLTRQLRVPMLVNEQTYREADGPYVARDLGLIRVKGKKQPAAIWEIVGRESEAFDHSYYTKFSEALDAARKSSRSAALERFQQLANLRPEDVAINLYLNLLASREDLGPEDLILEFGTK